MKLIVENLSFAYRGFPVLNGLSFEALPGEVTAVIGANAVGKSTLLKCLAGALEPTGRVLYNGEEIRRLSEHQRAHRIGYMVQDNGSSAQLTVLETVLLGRLHALTLKINEDELARVRAVLERLRIAPLANRYISQLSGGQRRMVAIAQTFVREPQILLLDEPTANLDLPNELEVLDLVRSMTRERRLVTVVTLHDLNTVARFADRVLLLEKGRIIRRAGRPEETLTAESIEEAYGVRVHILHDGGRLVIVPLEAVKK